MASVKISGYSSGQFRLLQGMWNLCQGVSGESCNYGTGGRICHYSGEIATEFRYKHCAALERVKGKIDQVDEEFGRTIGRTYGGQIEEYCTGDAEIVLLAMGSSAGTASVKEIDTIVKHIQCQVI